MARTAVTAEPITRTGIAQTRTPVPAGTDGDTVPAGPTILDVANDSEAPVTVTISTPGQVDGLDVADLAVVIPAGASRLLGPFPARTFAQADGLVWVDYSTVAGVSRAAYTL